MNEYKIGYVIYHNGVEICRFANLNEAEDYIKGNKHDETRS